MSRFRNDAKGNPEARCGRCQCWLAATRANFYMQHYKGRLVPHTWCIPCYGDDRALRRLAKATGNLPLLERPQREPCEGDAEQIHFISHIPAGRLAPCLVGPTV